MSYTQRNRPRKPTHPGTVLKDDVLPALGLSVSDAAGRIGVSRQFLYRILAGEAPVTAATALRIGKFCGNGPELWLNMQQACDLWEARQHVGREIAKIKTAEAA